MQKGAVKKHSPPFFRRKENGKRSGEVNYTIRSRVDRLSYWKNFQYCNKCSTNLCNVNIFCIDRYYENKTGCAEINIYVDNIGPISAIKYLSILSELEMTE